MNLCLNNQLTSTVVSKLPEIPPVQVAGIMLVSGQNLTRWGPKIGSLLLNISLLVAELLASPVAEFPSKFALLCQVLAELFCHLRLFFRPLEDHILATGSGQITGGCWLLYWLGMVCNQKIIH